MKAVVSLHKLLLKVVLDVMTTFTLLSANLGGNLTTIKGNSIIIIIIISHPKVVLLQNKRKHALDFTTSLYSLGVILRGV